MGANEEILKEEMSSGRISDYSRFLSPVSLARKPSAIRALAPLVALPGMISLGGGLPNPTAFPFERITVDLALKDGDTKSAPLVLEGPILSQALQYSATPGLPPFVSWLKKLQCHYHVPFLTESEIGIQVTTGSQDGLWKAFEMVLGEGDVILVESPTYSGFVVMFLTASDGRSVLAFLSPFPCEVVPIPAGDHDGMDPEKLEELLKNWPAEKKKPKALYVIPTGQNPSGSSLSLARKKKLYSLACQYDFLIFEDDPYYFLTYEGERIPSLLSLDTEGRVLRFDSFSKIMSSGMRLGFVSGPVALCKQIELHMQATSLHSCGLSQMLMYQLLEMMGIEGFERHISRIQALYLERRDWCVAAATELLGDMVEFHPPKAGMFLWMRLKGEDDTRALIQQEAVERKFLMVPGVFFDALGAPGPYVRASFSTASKEQIFEAFSRLAGLLRERRSTQT